MRLFDLDQLRALVAVAEVGSISGAVPRLNRSHSALSEQLQKLEALTGKVLLHRSKKGVSLTPAGERLLAHARDLLIASERALEDVQDVGFKGELRLAITDYFRPGAIAEILKQLKARYPALRLRVTICRDVKGEADCEGKGFDIGLSMRIAEWPDESGANALRQEPLVWTAAAELSLEGDPLPLLVLSDGWALDHYARRRLEEAQVPYFVAHSASGVAGLQSALAAGLGIACLNASSVPTCMTPLRTLPFLPTLHPVEFVLTPPRQGETALVRDVRSMLAPRFS